LVLRLSSVEEKKNLKKNMKVFGERLEEDFQQRDRERSFSE
jgi:hypothetical protein